MYKNYKKEIIKNVVIFILIMALAVFATYKIYYKFQKERKVDYNSESLEVVFHEDNGDKVTLYKITPVTDSVGLSSESYEFTVKNNLTVPVNYKIKLVDDTKTIEVDKCKDRLIPKDIIKVSLKDGKKNKIYNLNELQNNTIKLTKIKALGEKKYTLRVWTKEDAKAERDVHYHGLIKIQEENKGIATAK